MRRDEKRFGDYLGTTTLLHELSVFFIFLYNKHNKKHIFKANTQGACRHPICGAAQNYHPAGKTSAARDEWLATYLGYLCYLRKATYIHMATLHVDNGWMGRLTCKPLPHLSLTKSNHSNTINQKANHLIHLSIYLRLGTHPA